jgi:hypothetical protein
MRDERAGERSPFVEPPSSLVPHRSDCVAHPDEDVGVPEERRPKRSALEARRCVWVGMLEAFGRRRYERGKVPDPFRAMPYAFVAMPYAHRETPSVAPIAP